MKLIPEALFTGSEIITDYRSRREYKMDFETFGYKKIDYAVNSFISAGSDGIFVGLLQRGLMPPMPVLLRVLKANHDMGYIRSKKPA